MVDDSKFTVHQWIPKNTTSLSKDKSSEFTSQLDENKIVIVDPRNYRMGWRSLHFDPNVSDTANVLSSFANEKIEDASPFVYDQQRSLIGLPEGNAELFNSIPLEGLSNNLLGRILF